MILRDRFSDGERCDIYLRPKEEGKRWRWLTPCTKEVHAGVRQAQELLDEGIFSQQEFQREIAKLTAERAADPPPPAAPHSDSQALAAAAAMLRAARLRDRGGEQLSSPATAETKQPSSPANAVAKQPSSHATAGSGLPPSPATAA
ncbi:MAG: hypothetical protein ACPIOQ_82740, partial [Promethearchaeia archaeon]